MSIPEDLQQFVGEQVSLGNYETVDDVLAAGLNLLRSQHVALLKVELDEGLRQLESGECVHLPDEQSRRAFLEQIKRGDGVPVSCPAK